jgi:hypothetical protein
MDTIWLKSSDKNFSLSLAIRFTFKNFLKRHSKMASLGSFFKSLNPSMKIGDKIGTSSKLELCSNPLKPFNQKAHSPTKGFFNPGLEE